MNNKFMVQMYRKFYFQNASTDWTFMYSNKCFDLCHRILITSTSFNHFLNYYQNGKNQV